MNSAICLVSMPGDQPVNVIAVDDDEAILSPHRHDYYEIIWSLDDKGSHYIDFVEYPLKPFRLYTISPGQVHESSQLGHRARLITFKPSFLESSYRRKRMMDKIFSVHYARVPFIDIDDIAVRDLGSLFSIMLQEKSKPAPDYDLLDSLLSSFLRYLSHYASGAERKNTTLDERVLCLLELIDNNYRKQRKTEFYANLLNLTGKRLNELARKHIGKTVTGLIHSRILLEAHRELAFTTRTVKTIAIELGYDDPAYFGRFFRKMTGESPAAFRKRTFK